MKKLLLIVLLTVGALFAKAQNTVTLESGTVPLTTYSLRVKAITPDSLNHLWLFWNNKYNRLYTATEANLRFALANNVVNSVVGTTNRLTASPTNGNVVVDIASTYAGQTSINTLGTVTIGTWHGAVIGSAYGGAGTINGILKANGSGVVSQAVAGTDYQGPLTSGANLKISSNRISNQIATTLYSKSYFANTSDFSLVGSPTNSIVNNAIQLSGGPGNGVFSQYLTLTSVQSSNEFSEHELIFLVNSLGDGIGVGNKNTQSGGFNSSMDVTVNTSTNVATIWNVNSATVVKQITLPYTIAIGDLIRVRYNRNRTTVSAIVENLTQNTYDSFSATSLLGAGQLFPPPTIGKPAIFNHGGSNDVLSFKVVSTAHINPDVIVLGNSKAVGNNAFGYQLGFPYLLNSLGVVENLSSNSARTDGLLLNVPYVISLNPKYVILADIYRNDAQVSGAISSTTIANYTSIVSQLQSAGITVIHLIGMDELSVDQTSDYAWVTSTYPSGTIINILPGWVNATMLSSDNIHPTQYGERYVASQIIASGLIPASNNFPLNYYDYLPRNTQYINNGLTKQIGSNFNIDGNGNLARLGVGFYTTPSALIEGQSAGDANALSITNTATNPGLIQRSGNFATTYSQTSGAASQVMSGITVQATIGSANNQNLTNSGTAGITGIANGFNIQSGATGTISVVTGINNNFNISASGITITAASLWGTRSFSNSGTITYMKGIHIPDFVTGFTNQVGVQVGNGNYTGNWSIYVAGTHANYLGTNATLINTTTNNGVDKLQINGSSIGTAWKTTGAASTDVVNGDGSVTAKSALAVGNSVLWNSEAISTSGKGNGDVMQYDLTNNRWTNAVVSVTAPLTKSGAGVGGTWSITKADTITAGYIDTATYNSIPKREFDYTANSLTTPGTVYTFTVTKAGFYTAYINLINNTAPSTVPVLQILYTDRSNVAKAFNQNTTTSTGVVGTGNLVANFVPKVGTTVSFLVNTSSSFNVDYTLRVTRQR